MLVLGPSGQSYNGVPRSPWAHAAKTCCCHVSIPQHLTPPCALSCSCFCQDQVTSYHLTYRALAGALRSVLIQGTGHVRACRGLTCWLWQDRAQG